MKSETSAFDLFFITKELQKLKGAKLEKVFHSKDNKNEVLFRFYTKDYGKLFLKVNIPSHIYLTQYKEEHEVPSGFGMFLRRHLQSTRIISIEQRNFDRVLDFTFEIRKKGVMSINHLIIELFGTGNMILINEDSKILGLLYSQRWKDRMILPGKIYKFPESQFSPLNSDKKMFIEKIKSSKKDLIVPILASDLSLGGEYAEEICLRVGIDKENTNLSEEDYVKLYNEIQKMKQEEIKGFTYDKTVTPFQFLTAKNLKKEYDTFCEALDEEITEKKYSSELKNSQKKSESKLNKIENVLKKQQEMFDRILTDSDAFQKKGELIYEKYTELEPMFSELKELRKNKDWKEIKKIFKEKYPDIKINEKNNELIIEIEDKKSSSK